MPDSSASLRHQRSRSFEDGLPPTGYVASQVTVINNVNAPGTQNTNVFNSPSSAAKHKSVQRWCDEDVGGAYLLSIQEEEEVEEKEERGRRSSTPVERPATRRGHYELSGTDRDSLHSQQKSIPSTTMCRHGPGAKMVHIPAAKKYPTTDGFGQPVTPFAIPQPPVPTVEMAAFGMLHRKGFTELKGEGIGAPTATAAPFRRGHKRGKTTISSMTELAPQIVPRNEPNKGAVYNAEGIRAVGGQFAKEPTTPQCAVAAHFGFGAGVAEPEQAFVFGSPSFDSDDISIPYTPTPATNFIGHPRMDASSEPSSPYMPSSPPVFPQSNSSSTEDLRIFPKIVDKMSSDWIDSSSTVTAEKWTAFEETRSLKSIADSPSAFEDGSDQETPLPEPAEETPSPSGRRLHRVGNLNLSPKSDSSDTRRSVARAQFPSENVRYADAADGTAVFDFFFASGTWPHQVLRRVQFKSNPSFRSAPSVHRRSGSENSNESTMIFIDMDESDAEVPRGTLRTVNGSDSDEDDENAVLPSTLWNLNMGDEFAVVSTDAAARNTEIKVRRQPIETSSEDDEGSAMEPFDDSDQQIINVVKSHKHSGSLELLRHAVDTVKCAPTVITPIPRRPQQADSGVMDTGFQFPAAPPSEQLPVDGTSNTGILETGFQFPAAAPEEQRSSSMLILSMPTRETTDVKKHRRSGSFGKLLVDLSKSKHERNVLRKPMPIEKKEKVSLRRRLSEHIDGSFLPGSWKSAGAGDFQKEQLYFTGG
jgi:hypothetical protein